MFNIGADQPAYAKLLTTTVIEKKPEDPVEKKPSSVLEKKQAPQPLDLRGKDLDDAIEALTIKQKSKTVFTSQDMKELKRLRNIRGSRNFRQKSK